jgi:hypothetical protein
MTASKSPFFVVEGFLSPLLCEQILAHVDFSVPDFDVEDRPIKTMKTNELAETIIYQRLVDLFPTLEQYYGLEHKGTEEISFEWFPESSQGGFECGNAAFLRGKWLRVRPRDLSAILFLSDYQDKLPFEDDYEVYGGKLEFPQHAFSFQPKRGTLIIFPSDPHFINITSQVFAGDMFQARLHFAAKQTYLYQPTQFPGNFTTWFASYLNDNTGP